MNKIAAITFIVILLMYPFHSEARDNPFVSKKAPKKEVTLPAFASKCFAKIALWQHQLNEKLTEHVKRLKANRTWDTLLPLILISFLYGIIHAAGPGHGKVVVFSYFFSHRSSVKKGLLLGNLISLFHAASGVTIVLVLYFFIKAAYLSSFEAISQKIKLVSYSLIVMIGLTLLISSIFGMKNNSSPFPEADATDTPSDGKGILPLALAIGVVPCPGVVIIMLFALSFNLLFTGLMMSLIMALGMAVTISVAGLMSILGQEGLLKSFSRNQKAQNFIQKGLTVFGSLLILGFGGILLIGTL